MGYLKLYSTYLDVSAPINPEGFAPVRCPFHDDRKPSAGVSDKTGVFNCFKCGSLSAITFVQKITECTLDEASSLVEQYRHEENLIIREDNFVNRQLGRSPKLEGLYELSQKQMDRKHEVVQEYMRSRSIEYRTLKLCQVGYLTKEQTSWRRDSLVFPYIYGGRVVGLRYRDSEGNKGGEPGCHFTLWGVDELDTSQDTAIIVEGETDRLVTKQCLPEMPVVSTPTAAFKREWAREFEGINQVILIPQTDEPSQKNLLVKCKEYMPHTDVVQLRWTRRQWGKDVAEWMRYNAPEDLRLLVQKVVRRKSKGVMSGEEFDNLPEEDQPWLIDNFLGYQEVLAIVGHPKAFKTWIALDLTRTIIDPDHEFMGIKGFSTQTPGRVLFIEEEGSLRDFKERARIVLGDVPEWKENTFWSHRAGFKFDNPQWVEKLIDIVEEKDINLVFFDPFQRTHLANENETQEMSPIWSTISGILNHCPRLSIGILHHFNKQGTVLTGWTSMRGSSVSPASTDVGVFVEREGEKAKVKLRIDGRAIQPPTKAGSEVIHYDFDGGIFKPSLLQGAKAEQSKNGHGKVGRYIPTAQGAQRG